MAHVSPRSMDEMPDLAPVFEGAKAAMGFVPNSMLTMAHMPQLPVAFSMRYPSFSSSQARVSSRKSSCAASAMCSPNTPQLSKA